MMENYDDGMVGASTGESAVELSYAEPFSLSLSLSLFSAVNQLRLTL